MFVHIIRCGWINTYEKPYLGWIGARLPAILVFTWGTGTTKLSRLMHVGAGALRINE